MKPLNEKPGNNHVKLGLFDIDGILRGKYLHTDKLANTKENGLSFCDVVMGWDMNDKLYDKVACSGWQHGFPDAAIQICSQPRQLPYEDTPFYLCEFTKPFDAICPRQVLKRVIDKAEAMDLKPLAGFEYEFFVFDETPESVAAKNYQNLKPFTVGNCGYSILRNSVHADFHRQLLQDCQELGIHIEGLHCETGPGVLEAALTYDEALIAADNAAFFKTFTKVMAERQDRMATFMARWSEEMPGQSGHIHLSLRNSANKPVFYDENSKQGISQVMRHFLAGQQRLLPQLLPMLAPTINSYTRLVPGFWAPTQASAGIDNRTCALRIILAHANAQRIEYRAAGSDANPYLALAAALASGLWGIENQCEPEPLITGNAYEQAMSPAFQFPSGLAEATESFAQSELARSFFGDDFVDHFAATRRWEVQQAGRAVTDWQLQRYFELI